MLSERLCPNSSFCETAAILEIIEGGTPTKGCTETTRLILEIRNELGEELFYRIIDFAKKRYLDKDGNLLLREKELDKEGNPIPYLVHAIRVGAHAAMSATDKKKRVMLFLTGVAHDIPEDSELPVYEELRKKFAKEMKRMHVERDFMEIMKLQEIFAGKVRFLFKKDLRESFPERDEKEIFYSASLVADASRLGPEGMKYDHNGQKYEFKWSCLSEKLHLVFDQYGLDYAVDLFRIKFEDYLDYLFSLPKKKKKTRDKARKRYTELENFLEEVVDKVFPQIEIYKPGHEVDLGRLLSWYEVSRRNPYFSEEKGNCRQPDLLLAG